MSAEVRVSQSFEAEEIEWLDELFRVLLRGGDASILMRAPAARKVIQRTKAMKVGLARQRIAARRLDGEGHA